MVADISTSGREYMEHPDKEEAYIQLEKYFNEIPKFTSKNQMRDTRCSLEALGHPGEDRKIIHVAGTNGKGSVCAYLCSVLKEAGFRVGMFCSPHLIEMRERFQINGQAVGREEFVRAFSHIMERLEHMRKSIGRRDYHPTYFELLFLMGMVIFDWENVDYIILETGLGGRLDATNAVEKPLLTIITEIGFDHMQYLGDTIEKIAGEKAGIIKAGVPVVFCDKRREASEVIIKRGEMLGNKVVAVSAKDVLHRNLTNKSIDFSLHSRYYDYIRLNLRTKALYQIENAALAVRAIEELPDVMNITKEQLTAGIRNTVWEGRMEEVLPGVYVDGAHNRDGMDAFMQTVEADGCRGNRYLLFSAVEDKDYVAMIKALNSKRLFEQIVVSRINDGRGAEPESLCRLFAESGESGNTVCACVENMEEALNNLLLLRKKGNDIIYIVGSLYLVGEIKAMLRRRTDD